MHTAYRSTLCIMPRIRSETVEYTLRSLVRFSVYLIPWIWFGHVTRQSGSFLHTLPSVQKLDNFKSLGLTLPSDSVGTSSVRCTPSTTLVQRWVDPNSRYIFWLWVCNNPLLRNCFSIESNEIFVRENCSQSQHSGIRNRWRDFEGESISCATNDYVYACYIHFRRRSDLRLRKSNSISI